MYVYRSMTHTNYQDGQQGVHRIIECQIFGQRNSCDSALTMLLMGMWISLTKYPMKPITTNPRPTARQIWIYSAKWQVEPRQSLALPQSYFASAHLFG